MRFGCFGKVKDIEAIAAAGFDFIELDLRELVGLSDGAFGSVCARLAACGLGADACSWILPAELDMTSAETKFEDWEGYLQTGAARSRDLGVKLWPIGSGRGRSMKSGNGTMDQQQQRVRNFISRLARISHDAGILALIEPLGPDYSNYLQTLDETVAFINELQVDGVMTMCDLRHMTAAGEPLSDVEKWGRMIAHAHIDVPLGNRRRFPRPDDGYNYTEYFRMLQKIGMETLSVEALHEENLADGAGSIAYMRELLDRTRAE